MSAPLDTTLRQAIDQALTDYYGGAVGALELADRIAALVGRPVPPAPLDTDAGAPANQENPR